MIHCTASVCELGGSLRGFGGGILYMSSCRRLTWEAATQRLLRAAAISAEEWPSIATSFSDSVAWSVYRPFSFIEVISRVGAPPEPFQAPYLHHVFPFYIAASIAYPVLFS